MLTHTQHVRFPSRLIVSLKELATKYRHKGNTKVTRALIIRILEICYRWLGQRHPYNVRVLNWRARYESFNVARRLYLRAYKICKHACGKPALLAKTLNKLTLLYLKENLYDQAFISCRRTLSICHDVLGYEQPITLYAQYNMADINASKRNYDYAYRLYKLTLPKFEMVFGYCHLDTATFLVGWGKVCTQLFKFAEAATHFERALAISKSVLKPNHSEIVSTEQHLQKLCNIIGSYDKTKPVPHKLMESLIPLTQTSSDSTTVIGHSEMARFHNNQSVHLERQGKLLAATTRYYEAIEYMTAADPSGKDMATLLHNAANLYRDRNMFETAREKYQSALQLYETILGPNDYEMASTIESLASVLEIEGNFEQAILYYTRALKIYEALPDRVLETVSTLDSLACLFEKSGQHNKADDHYTRALQIRKTFIERVHDNDVTSTCVHWPCLRLFQPTDDVFKDESLRELILQRDEKVTPFWTEEPCLQKMGRIYVDVDGLSKGSQNHRMGSYFEHLPCIYQRVRRYDDANSLSRRLLAINANVLGQQHLNVSILLNMRGEYLLGLEKHSLAEQWYLDELAIYDNLKHRHTVCILFDTIRLYHNRKMHEKTEPLYKRAIDILVAGYGSDNRTITSVLCEKANQFIDKNRFEEAEQLSMKALEISKSAFGSEGQATVNSMVILATAYMGQGLFITSSKYYHEVLDISLKLQRGVETALMNLVWLYRNTKQFDMAIEYLKRMHTIQEARLGCYHSVTVATLFDIGMEHVFSGKIDDAIRLIRETLDKRVSNLGSDHVDTVSSMITLAELYIKINNSNEAGRLCEQLLRVNEFGNNYLRVGSLLKYYGNILLENGDNEKANVVMSRSLEILTKCG